MNRLPSLVRRHKELYNIGTEIIHNHNMNVHYRNVNTPWKIEGLKEHNLRLMGKYAKKSDEINTEWDSFGTTISKFWKGQINLK